MCQASFFGNDHDGMSFEAVITLLLLGSQGGASLLEASPDSIDHWNWYTKLGPFFSTYSFNHITFNNQTFIVYKVH